MPEESKVVSIKKKSIMESIKEAAEEAQKLPQWQRDLSGFRSNYPSELQPCKGEIDKGKMASV